MSIIRAATAYIRYRRPHVLGGAIQVAWQARGRWDPLKIFSLPICSSAHGSAATQAVDGGGCPDRGATEELARATPGTEALEAGLLIF